MEASTGGTTSTASGSTTDRTPYTVEVAEGVHAYVQPDGSWCLNNSGFVTGGDGSATVLIDTAATISRAERLRDAVTATGAPAPRQVVNTHFHGDHTYGNCVFADDAVVIGHANCRAETIAAGFQLSLIWPDVVWGDVAITPPTVTYSDRMTLYAGDTEIQLIHPGAAHTTGDSIVWIPQRRTVFTGDLVFSGGTPFILMGSVEGSLRALDRLRALDAETIVPGHGELCGPEAYDTAERYLRFLQRTAADGLAAGRTPLEAAVEADLGEFADLSESERLAGNLHRAFAEARGAAPGTPLDYPAAMLDMAAYNGSPVIPCHA